MVNSENYKKVSVSDRLMSVRGLSKSFDHSGDRIDVLKGIDLDLDAGETLAIVGASGIGKSTLLHILSFLIMPGWHNFETGTWALCSSFIICSPSFPLLKIP